MSYFITFLLNSVYKRIQMWNKLTWKIMVLAGENPEHAHLLKFLKVLNKVLF